MDYDIWYPLYNEIIKDFNYSEEEDINSALALAESRISDDLAPLKMLKGKRVEIHGPLIEKSCCDIQIIAGSALTPSLEVGGKPDLLVTDLDGDAKAQQDLNSEGVPAVIHAHGDNIDLIKRWASRFTGHVICTCQCAPPPGIYNFGGFTDGDRAVFIADHFGAKEVILNGWNFDSPASGSMKPHIKLKKLRWAKKLIDMVDTPVKILD